MLQSHVNGTINQEYKRVVEKYQRYLNERSKLKHQSNDKLSAAVRKIYLNPLLPSLQSDHQQSTNRIRKRQSLLLKEQYSHFKQESVEQINANLQLSIANHNSNSVPKKQNHSQANLETPQQQSFFIGLYKNQRIENQCKNITIKDLVQYNKSSQEQLQNITHLPQLQQQASNEINLSKYFVKKPRPKKISFDEISFSNKWERERGSNLVRIDKLQVEEFSENVVEYLLKQDIMRLFFQNSSVLQLKAIMLELFKGVYYESTLNFESIIEFFTTQQITYLEIFYIKYSISQILINANYNYIFVERALNQFEEYRYLLQKPIPFITKLFDNTFYSNVVKGIMMKLLKSPAYNKFMTNQKYESESFIYAVKNGLFPYLVGEYVGLPLHARVKDVKAEQFRQQILQPYINQVFVIQVKNLLNEYFLDEFYIKEVERRLQFPKQGQDLPEETYFPLHYIQSYLQCKNTIIPSYDIKAMMRLIKINSSQLDSDSDVFAENIKYLDQFEQMKEELQLFK
ncbi:unnamed protein product (macronuclear) [Paramecium tetraurelia]|uniref:RGS domain-containing protein n=1 Tax=Paramecium tetraurelia TaxID=5888 RepID=A0ECX3_PARTE|nr:uncharacterized protein GSPATT00004009001 [Paramecium tetraurelia]CAK93140.1 unnamed protein product [Paramecium tetraurelia]|eukprot:XP_001460537.1 hypothetical protein (macronuclear) [Paramecium tetraurelia strain d4-2]